MSDRFTHNGQWYDTDRMVKKLKDAKTLKEKYIILARIGKL